MSEPKWYEEICISIGFTPFCWRLKPSIEPMWGSASFYLGPFWLHFGWPSSQTAHA